MARVVNNDLSRWRRTIVLSDLHAHAALFDRMLEELEFGERDLLVVCGDLLLRGSENLPLLRRAVELSGRENVVLLGGNCDAAFEFLASRPDGPELGRWLREHPFPRELLAAEGGPQEGVSPGALRDRLLARFARARRFLAALPDVLVTPQAVFVHGGLPGPDLVAAPGWDSDACRKNDDYLAHAPVLDRPVMVGHWPATLYRAEHPDFSPLWDAEKRVLSIDGGLGVKPEGQLNAVVIPGGDFGRREYRALDELPVLRALDPQAGTENSLYIRWGDNRVERGERRDEFTYVRHLRTGRALWARTDDLWEENGRTCCADSTDWLLPVVPGDLLRLVADTTRGRLVKKNGAVGWYKGRCEEP